MDYTMKLTINLSKLIHVKFLICLEFRNNSCFLSRSAWAWNVAASLSLVKLIFELKNLPVLLVQKVLTTGPTRFAV